MHIFLTGEKGVGKSTAVQRTLALLGAAYGGFRTGFTSDRSRLCLWSAWGPPRLGQADTVADMVDGRCVTRPGAFDRLGTAALAGGPAGARLLVMDELGTLERDEADFQRAVLDCLDGPAAVLGVIKPQRAGTWLEALADRPDVAVVQVTEENRDGLPGRSVQQLNLWMKD